MCGFKFGLASARNFRQFDGYFSRNSDVFVHVMKGKCLRVSVFVELPKRGF